MTPISDSESVGDIRKANMYRRVNLMYGRTDTFVWSYEEVSLLELLARRPGFIEELDKVLAFKKSCSWRFFPQSVAKLLNSWTTVLDRAQQMKQAPVTKSTPKPVQTAPEITDEQRAEYAKQIRERLKQRL